METPKKPLNKAASKSYDEDEDAIDTGSKKKFVDEDDDDLDMPLDDMELEEYDDIDDDDY